MGQGQARHGGDEARHVTRHVMRGPCGSLPAMRVPPRGRDGVDKVLISIARPSLASWRCRMCFCAKKKDWEGGLGGIARCEGECAGQRASGVDRRPTAARRWAGSRCGAVRKMHGHAWRHSWGGICKWGGRVPARSRLRDDGPGRVSRSARWCARGLRAAPRGGRRRRAIPGVVCPKAALCARETEALCSLRLLASGSSDGCRASLRANAGLRMWETLSAMAERRSASLPRRVRKIKLSSWKFWWWKQI